MFCLALNWERLHENLCNTQKMLIIMNYKHTWIVRHLILCNLVGWEQLTQSVSTFCVLWQKYFVKQCILKLIKEPDLAEMLSSVLHSHIPLRGHPTEVGHVNDTSTYCWRTPRRPDCSPIFFFGLPLTRRRLIKNSLFAPHPQPFSRKQKRWRWD